MREDPRWLRRPGEPWWVLGDSSPQPHGGVGCRGLCSDSWGSCLSAPHPFFSEALLSVSADCAPCDGRPHPCSLPTWSTD